MTFPIFKWFLSLQSSPTVEEFYSWELSHWTSYLSRFLSSIWLLFPLKKIYIKEFHSTHLNSRAFWLSLLVLISRRLIHVKSSDAENSHSPQMFELKRCFSFCFRKLSQLVLESYQHVQFQSRGAKIPHLTFAACSREDSNPKYLSFRNSFLQSMARLRPFFFNTTKVAQDHQTCKNIAKVAKRQNTKDVSKTSKNCFTRTRKSTVQAKDTWQGDSVFSSESEIPEVFRCVVWRISEWHTTPWGVSIPMIIVENYNSVFLAA